MDFAVDPKSATGAVMHVVDWHRERRDEVAMCMICGSPVKRRPAQGQGKLHFFHLQGSNCPTIEPAGKRYEPLKNLPRDPSIGPANRAYVFSNLIGVHDRMKKYLSNIWLSQVLTMCQVATKKDYWSLKGMPHEMLPYMLLTCMDQFPPLGQRIYPVYFVIQGPPSGSFYWNFPVNHTRHILEVDASSPGSFTTKAIDLSPPVNSTVEQLRTLLT